MANLTPEQALEQARAAAKAAQDAAAAAVGAADKAQGILGDLSAQVASAHAAASAVDPFVFQFSIFVMAIFVGYYVVWSVTPALHTPLMSVTNAISSVIVVGALLAVGVDWASGPGAGWARGFGFVGTVLAAVNIFGGFMVTSRMLAMYKKKS
ncbi:proton-translocating transhydrogenase family protein [Prosthecomicrobium hirschii]|jgi:NAD(P) transhydrogenase subunit alpha|uniref:proton-translocating NAD(P)(+) transhydrogenase n=1 Tax=Prosthecodimorpha hirschii TaxID=665126 RepID=A0A0P6WC32_9HYPH|nr:proton-translocating transhydrogenase family protein [Prosthecomicrobium hirschii]KPL52212.1 NAD synthetase [Prosthecomicrobium hirschii]MCW1843396.1 proton-translocating transhydrogenase family protein [Prosthecomicrobium hirschii]TPQ52175.1 NAD synthetase [Prosthecomicrobium hirschii]